MSQSAPVSTKNENEDPFTRLIVDAMQELLGFSLYPFQKLVIPHIIKIKYNYSSSILLAYETGNSRLSL